MLKALHSVHLGQSSDQSMTEQSLALEEAPNDSQPELSSFPVVEVSSANDTLDETLIGGFGMNKFM